MISLTTLWLPIVLSTVAVFIASNILWMALPFWHRRDYGKLPDERPILDALSNAASGQYIAPFVNWSKLPKEEREAMQKRPMALVLVRNPAKFAFPAALSMWIVYLLLITILIAWIPAATLSAGAPYADVFCIVFAATILAHSFGSVSDSIWYGKPWSVTVKEIVDGIIYGLVTAALFAWLWPR
jgi:hypothetical protein